MSKHVGDAISGKHSNNIHHHESEKKVSSPSVLKAKNDNRSGFQSTETNFVKTGSAQDIFLKNLITPAWEKNAFPAKVAKSGGEPVKVTYVPLNERHKGVSKYDVLPHFANRPKNFPDRYRAVNPKLAAEGIKGEKALSFPLKAGKIELKDGNGETRGIVRRNSVKLNYAQVKTIDGEKYYYAFATRISKTEKGHTTKPASGWIKASAIKAGNDPRYTEGDIKRSTAKPVNEVHGKHENYQQYTVKNVAPKEITGADGKPKYGYVKNGKFVSYKVLPGKTKDTNFAAGDYLQRTGGVINLGFNAAGLSNDTLNVVGKDAAGKKVPLVFHRAPTSVKSATVDIDLYHPKDAKHAGQKPIKKMRFVYGYVESEGVKRWGWMPLGALHKK